MAKWEFAIAIKDEADLASGHKRKKEGDIISVKPAPWNWGKKEVKEYLIVTMDGLTEQEAHNKCKPYWDWEQKGEDPPKLIPNTITYFDEDLQKEVTDTTMVFDKEEMAVAKRRYKIPLSKLTESNSLVDLSKIKDPKVEYQPFQKTTLTKSFVLDNHTGSYLK